MASNSDRDRGQKEAVTELPDPDPVRRGQGPAGNQGFFLLRKAQGVPHLIHGGTQGTFTVAGAGLYEQGPSVQVWKVGGRE